MLADGTAKLLADGTAKLLADGTAKLLAGDTAEKHKYPRGELTVVEELALVVSEKVARREVDRWLM
ncbi:Uncharacterised protein [Actinobaculum suis]|uniref:Uncharacterized protein n=1 Tax=Actinobaculum suis TaxID=1657 RepID=A0A7Z8Y808_9ACTO|nr:hypothetical protein [Actinobaculum suis]VDG75901.1 Uncharacterised protein [Actinobaculum suis]